MRERKVDAGVYMAIAIHGCKKLLNEHEDDWTAMSKGTEKDSGQRPVLHA